MTTANHAAKPKPKKSDRIRKDGQPMNHGARCGLTVARCEEALRSAGGLQTYAAAKLGVSRKTLQRFMDANPELREVRQEIREEIGDLAESKLLQGVKDGDPRLLMFFLKTQHKDRGYSERHELTGKDGEAIETTTTAERSVALRQLTTDDLRAAVERMENAGATGAEPIVNAAENGAGNVDENDAGR